MYESIVKNTYNVIKQLCLYYTYKRLWQGYTDAIMNERKLMESSSVNANTENAK